MKHIFLTVLKLLSGFILFPGQGLFCLVLTGIDF